MISACILLAQMLKNLGSLLLVGTVIVALLSELHCAPRTGLLKGSGYGVAMYVCDDTLCVLRVYVVCLMHIGRSNSPILHRKMKVKRHSMANDRVVMLIWKCDLIYV